MGQSPPGVTVVDLHDEDEVVDGLPFIQGNAEFGAKFPVPRKRCTRPLKTADQGDLLISVRAPVGHTNQVDTPLAIGRGLAAVRFVGTDSSFGWHTVNRARKGLRRVSQGSTFEAIGSAELRALVFRLPPLEEQRAIAAVLDSIDETIELTEEVIAATERLRDALLHELLTRGLPGQHSEWKEVPGLGTIPASWKVIRLGDVCDRPEYGANAPALPFDHNLPRYVRITDITDDGRLLSVDRRSADPKRTRGFELSAGDLLFARSGVSAGRTYLHRSGNGPCVYAGYLIRFRALPDVALPEFLERWTRSQFYSKWVRSMRRSGAQPNINATEYSSLPILLPSLAEQQGIADVLDSVDAAIERARDERNAMHESRTAIAEALLTGRVRTASLLGRRLDLVTEKAIDAEFRPHVEREPVNV